MIELIITSAGKKEIVNAQQTGTSAIKLSPIGAGSGKCTATEAQTSLQSETKRLPIVERGACSDAVGRDGKGVEVDSGPQTTTPTTSGRQADDGKPYTRRPTLSPHLTCARNGTSAIFRTRFSALSGAFSFGSTGSKTTRFTTSALLRRMSFRLSTMRGWIPLIMASFSSIRSTMDPTAIPYLIAI